MRIQDFADILIMTILVYQLYIWFRKTRALQVVLGLGSLALLYVITKNLGLFMTSWILQELGTVIFVLIIVVFQGEIRQALYRFSLFRNFFDRNDHSAAFDIPAVASTVFALAEQRTGALLVFERQEKLDDLLLHGVPLDSLVSSQLLFSLFEASSPLHDGAVVIKNGRIAEASTHLPLSTSSELPQHLGTRHRAAVGLTERSDALVIVVSEERGRVSVVTGGELFEAKSAQELESLLVSSLETKSADAGKIPFRKRVFSNVVPKFVTLTLVLACWSMINARQGGVQTVMAPVKFHNLPENLVLKNDLPAELEVQLKSLSAIFTQSGKMDVSADLDLSRLHEGLNSIAVDNKAFQLPLGVSVVKIAPAVIKVVAEKRVYREIPVVLNKVGRLRKGVIIRSISLEPTTVTTLGSESELYRLRQIYTEPFDLSTLSRSQTVELRLLLPASQIQFKGSASVKAKIAVSGR
jgi:diadenylate cyclase